jgi:uncharacterized protein (TIGR03083 family)
VDDGTAYQNQLDALVEWLAELPAAEFARPSVLPGWDVRTLVGHIAMINHGLTARLAERSTEAPIPMADYVRLYARNRAAIGALTETMAGDHSPAALIALIRAQPRADAALARLTPKTVIAGGRGPTTVADWVVTRLLDLTVHTDDLSRSLPDLGPAPITRPALAASTRLLAEILAAQAPGRSVEIRIAPFAAVQAIAGPPHKRGTPGSVIETDPVTWLRLATGRTTWAEAMAAAAVRASGQRADLSEYLPVLS